MKSDEDMALGIKRAKDVLYNMYRTGALSQEDYDKYKDYDFKKDFLPSGSVSGTSRTISTMQPWQKLLTACTTTLSNEIMSLRKN